METAIYKFKCKLLFWYKINELFLKCSKYVEKRKIQQ
jgi:hypothetical protein